MTLIGDLEPCLTLSVNSVTCVLEATLQGTASCPHPSSEQHPAFRADVSHAGVCDHVPPARALNWFPNMSISKWLPRHIPHQVIEYIHPDPPWPSDPSLSFPHFSEVPTVPKFPYLEICFGFCTPADYPVERTKQNINSHLVEC